jgi:hypothetical protein
VKLINVWLNGDVGQREKYSIKDTYTRADLLWKEKMNGEKQRGVFSSSFSKLNGLL